MYRQLRITDSTRTALLGHNEIDEDYYHALTIMANEIFNQHSITLL
jgi:hypothetical protein